MISSLSGGTQLHPVLSVTAPPGTQFYSSNPKPVPIVYGNAFVEGSIISPSNIVYSGLFFAGGAHSALTATAWQVICAGKVKLNFIYFNSDLHTFNGLPYNPAELNDGSRSNDTYPLIYESISGGLTLCQFLSSLHGIAHYFFTKDDGLTIGNGQTMQKVKYDVTRALETGLSIHGDDIPAPAADSLIVQSNLTYQCVFTGGGGGGVIMKNAPDGLIQVDCQVVFYKNGTQDLPSTISEGTPYYVIEIEYHTGIPDIPFRISATKGGPQILFHDHVAIPYLGSYVLTRNAGNNPAAVIWDILTNALYGLGLDATLDDSNADINVASFQAVHQFFYDAGTNGKPYGVNCAFMDKTPAKDMIKKVCEWTDCVLTLDTKGRFYLTVNDPARLTTSGRMGGAAGDPGSLSTDDFITFTPTIKTFDDTINEFRGKYISFADNFANLEVFFRNEANISATGTTRSKDFDLSCFIFPDIVSLRLHEIAKRESFPLITISTICKIGLLPALVNDIFLIIYPEYGINGYFKITKKVIDALDSSRIKVDWIQCSELMFDLNSTNIIQANLNPDTNAPADQVTAENVTFPAGSNQSNARTVAYSDPSTSHVAWGAGQANQGTLIYTADNPPTGNDDYTIDGTNMKIILNPTKWANTIQANCLGLLSVDTW